MTPKEQLEVAISAAYGDDPHLGLPHPETVTAIAEAVLLICEVSKRRPVAYASEPWRTIDSVEHTDHAVKHIEESILAICGSGKGYLDNDGLPHAAHAMLRLAFALTRYQQEGGK